MSDSINEDLQSLMLHNNMNSEIADLDHPLARLLKKQRDDMSSNLAFEAITQGLNPPRSLTFADWAPVGSYCLGLRALHVLTHPELPLIPFGPERATLPPMKATLTAPLGPLLKEGGWVAVFNQARRAVNKWHQKKGSPIATGSLHPMQQMLDQIDQYAGKEEYTKVIQNIYFAALHLAWLEQDSRHGARIDYPETAQQFSNHLQTIGSQSWTLPSSLQGSSYKVNNLQFPLCHRETLLHLAYALGPHEHRPTILKEIEEFMWSHLRRISRNEITANEFIDLLINKFSQQLLDTVSEEDNKFFSHDYDEHKINSGSGGFIEEMIRAGTPSPVGQRAYIENVIWGTTPAPTRLHVRHTQSSTPNHPQRHSSSPSNELLPPPSLSPSLLPPLSPSLPPPFPFLLPLPSASLIPPPPPSPSLQSEEVDKEIITSKNGYQPPLDQEMKDIEGTSVTTVSVTGAPVVVSVTGAPVVVSVTGAPVVVSVTGAPVVVSVTGAPVVVS
ncbi:hypothetical protein F5878DRAFT_667822, partial [Lentinula raphanica]